MNEASFLLIKLQDNSSHQLLLDLWIIWKLDFGNIVHIGLDSFFPSLEKKEIILVRNINYLKGFHKHILWKAYMWHSLMGITTFNGLSSIILLEPISNLPFVLHKFELLDELPRLLDKVFEFSPLGGIECLIGHHCPSSSSFRMHHTLIRVSLRYDKVWVIFKPVQKLFDFWKAS